MAFLSALFSLRLLQSRQNFCIIRDDKHADGESTRRIRFSGRLKSRLREGHRQAASVRECICAEVHSRVAPLNAPLFHSGFCTSAARTGNRFIASGDAEDAEKSGLPVGGDGPSRYRRKECLLLYRSFCTAKTWVVPRSLQCAGFVPDDVRGRGFLFFVFRAKTVRSHRVPGRAFAAFWANG